jgi:hypothetical protein
LRGTAPGRPARAPPTRYAAQPRTPKAATLLGELLALALARDGFCQGHCRRWKEGADWLARFKAEVYEAERAKHEAEAAPAPPA